MLEILLLVLSVSIDSFITAFSYGVSKIKISILPAIIISGTGCAFLGVSMLFANFIASFIPLYFGKILSASLLMIIGGVTFFNELIKNFLRKNKGIKQLSFKCSGIGFVLSLYLDEANADIDNSKSLSAREATLLALALSADNLVTGFSAGLFKDSTVHTVMFAFVLGFLAVFSGSKLGGAYQKKCRHNMSFLSGAVLMILAFLRLFKTK